MEKKKKTQVAVNVSSGAEKVEEVQKTVKKKAPGMQETQIDVKKINAESTDGKAEKDDVKILNADGLVFTHQHSGKFVQEVIALVRNSFVYLG